MSYSESLTKIIDESKLSLREISNRCKKEYNTGVDPAYISRLKTGAQNPPSDEVSIALAKVCGGNPDDLILEGYIEKAPEIIRDFLNKMVVEAKDFVKQLIKMQFPEDIGLVYEQQFNQTSDLDIIKQILKDGLIPGQLKDNSMIVQDHEDKDVKMMINPLFGIKMPDDSMEPIIPNGANLQLIEPNKAINGSIVVAVSPNEKIPLIRRYVPIEDKIFLMPENKNFEPNAFNKDSVVIVATIKSYTKEL